MNLWAAMAAITAVLTLSFQPAEQKGAPAQGTVARPATDTFAQQLDALDAVVAKVSDLRADFEQRRHTPLLKKPLVSKGRVLTRGDAVRWDTLTPRASTLLIAGGEVRMYYPDDKLVEVYPMGEGFKDIAGSPLPRLAMLRARFEIAPLPLKELGAAEADAGLLAVLLTPRSDDLRRHVVSVKVLIDKRTGAANKVVMTDPEGERTEILFSGVQLNSGVTEADVTLKLPEGVRTSHPKGEGKGPPKGEPKADGKGGNA